MPPRYAYWTIIAGGLPTAFRAADRDELMPTFTRLREKHPDAEMKWFARGKLWASPEAARVPREPREDGERARGDGRERPRAEKPGGRAPDVRRDRERTRTAGTRDQNWRPGGEHRDPRQKYKDAKKARNVERRREKFARKQGAPREEGGRDWRPADNRGGGTRPGRQPRDDRERQERPRGDWRPSDRPRGKWDGGGESRGPRAEGRSDRRPPRAREDRSSGGAPSRSWEQPREERPQRPKGDWDRAGGRKPHAAKGTWNRPGGGRGESGKRDWSRPAGGGGESGKRDWSRSPGDAGRPTGEKPQWSRPPGPKREWGRPAAAKGEWRRPPDSRPEGRKPGWDRTRGERDSGGEARARQDRPWRPADQRGAGNRIDESGAGRGGTRDRFAGQDRRPRDNDRGSGMTEQGARRFEQKGFDRRGFERKGFERNQGTEEPSAPPRPRGPNREPKPSEAPEPTPPPRPSEPVVPPPGPPERGRLVRRKRQQ